MFGLIFYEFYEFFKTVFLGILETDKSYVGRK